MQPRALTNAERPAILELLHSDRFVDLAPAEVWAILMDDGTYLGFAVDVLPAAGARRPAPANAAGGPPIRRR